MVQWWDCSGARGTEAHSGWLQYLQCGGLARPGCPPPASQPQSRTRLALHHNTPARPTIDRLLGDYHICNIIDDLPENTHLLLSFSWYWQNELFWVVQMHKDDTKCLGPTTQPVSNYILTEYLTINDEWKKSFFRGNDLQPGATAKISIFATTRHTHHDAIASVSKVI